MTLSEAIERGAYGLLTRGPDFYESDPYRAAFRGVYDRDPNDAELRAFYHAEPWGFPSDAEYALRMFCLFGVTWAETIRGLREYGL